jgi:hypothetical protein
MNTMLKTINTPTISEAAEAASALYWQGPVTDRRQLGSVLPLAERCAR